MLLTLIELDAADWARQEAWRWLEAERRVAPTIDPGNPQ
jgi:hypothetical protein